MLWYKYLIEIRWRFLMVALVFSLNVYGMQRSASSGNLSRGLDSFIGVLCIATIFAAASGIKTESGSLQPVKGMHASTWFTLTLPISRLRLFVTRSTVGISFIAFVTIFCSWLLWMLVEPVHRAATLAQAFEFGLVIFGCSLSLYFLSALLSVYLDATWQLYGTMLIAAALWWLTRNITSPFNVFHALAAAAPIVTPDIPWEAIGTSLLCSVALFITTARIIERHEF
jgi:hypothetical protein